MGFELTSDSKARDLPLKFGEFKFALWLVIDLGGSNIPQFLW